MEYKKCMKCHETKSVEEYSKKTKAKDGLQQSCRECRKAESKKYYADNGEHMKKVINIARNRRKLEVVQKIGEYLSEHPCVDCKESNILVLDFDHLPEFKKLLGISELLRNGINWDRIKNEIDKCEVRCKNCHTIKTYERLGNSDWRNTYLQKLDTTKPVMV